MQEPLTVEEIQRAENLIIEELQRNSFAADIEILQSVNAEIKTKTPSAQRRDAATKKQSSLYRLDPFIDDSGLLRVGGRLTSASIPYEEKHPL